MYARRRTFGTGRGRSLACAADRREPAFQCDQVHRPGFVAFDAWLEEGRLLFRVSDTGRGIGPEERERIFQEFVRLPSAGGVSGVGLGLSIVDRLVKLLGGTIELESEPGAGSRFLVAVPVGEAEDDASGKGSRSGDVFGQSVYGGRTTPPLPAGG